MAPHPKYSYRFCLFDHLIDQAMHDIDAAGVGAVKIADEFFVTWGILKRIGSDDLNQFFGFIRQFDRREVLRIFLRLFAVEDRIAYHSTDSLNSCRMRSWHP